MKLTEVILALGPLICVILRAVVAQMRFWEGGFTASAHKADLRSGGDCQQIATACESVFVFFGSLVREIRLSRAESKVSH